VMSELQMLPRETPGNVPSNVTEHFIENSSPGSGHLQVCHLAPVSGLFFPEVAIGTHISAGEKIGSVREIGSSESRVICADHDGLVIMLRTFPSVRQGESLAVVAHG